MTIEYFHLNEKTAVKILGRFTEFVFRKHHHPEAILKTSTSIDILWTSKYLWTSKKIIKQAKLSNKMSRHIQCHESKT